MNKLYLTLCITFFLFSSCNSSEESSEPLVTVNEVVYDLSGVTNSNISGQATFLRNEDNTTTVYIRLNGASELEHPASINYNNVFQTGGVAITLNSCECLESETLVASLEDGTPIDFDELLNFNGHINVYESVVLNNVIIAQTNIGSNAN